MTEMKQNCRLCHHLSTLRQSHLIPGFVIQWMKDTGPKYLRQATNPNLRRQDGLKELLLCDNCEQLIGQDEKKFKERVFTPFLENPHAEIRYDAFLIRFIVSLTWRVLVSEPGIGRLHRRFDEKLAAAELEWRKFLLKKAQLKEYDRFHICLRDIMSSPSQPVRVLNQYLTRFTDACVAMSQSECAVYVKFSRFIIWAEITQFDQSQWVGTQIEKTDGILKTPQQVTDGRFGNFLLHRAKLASEHYWKGISQRQQSRISDYFQKEAPLLVGTDFWRSLKADMEAEIDFKGWVGRTLDPSEICPCGSGKTYGKCHGEHA